MKDEKLLDRVKKRFEQAKENESAGRVERLDDIKFVRLGEQWPDSVKRDRERPGRERPMLTINRLFQFRNQVINEIRQNLPAIKVHPVDDKADVDTAEVLQGIIRHIESRSRADLAYDMAAEWQVDTGLGYIRILVDYCDDNSFNQDILIKRIIDPSAVYYDDNSTEPDGSDANWAFIETTMSRDEFDETYPDAKTSTFDERLYDDWVTKDSVKLVEYFEIEESKRVIVQLQDGSIHEKKDVPEEYKDLIVNERTAASKVCKWYKIGGNEVLEQSELPTSFIPIIPVIGSEVWIEGTRHVHGLTKHAKSAAQMYNFFASANAEFLALAPRVPYIVAEGQIDGYEAEWQNADRVNFSVLTYNPVTTQGQLAGAPQRQHPPGTNPGFESGMNRAVDDMKSSMGIFDASLGNHEANQSGRAILSQQNQSSTGNFHFSDNLSRSIRQIGKIIVEMIPHIYDTARTARIIGYDGTQDAVKIDPDQQSAKTEQQDPETGEIQSIYNLGIGQYDVIVDTGPSYASRRQEASATMMQFVQADPSVLQIAGDLIVRNYDWPGADEIADRMKLSLPPNLQESMDKGSEQSKVDPQIEQQMNHMADQMQHMSQELQAAQKKLSSDNDKIEIERFKAETERMKVIEQIRVDSYLTDAKLHKMALDNMSATIALGNTGEAADMDDNGQDNEQQEQPQSGQEEPQEQEPQSPPQDQQPDQAQQPQQPPTEVQQ